MDEETTGSSLSKEVPVSISEASDSISKTPGFRSDASDSPSSDAESQVKPWRLPFWTENLVHRSTVLNTRDDEEEVELEDELEEDTVELQYPTAEELEIIRREAYNEGLEQGLVEGRQTGYQKGYDEGRQQGHSEGMETGTQEGREQGFRAGEQDGRQSGEAQINEEIARCQALVHQLMASITERDRQLPEVLTGLLVQMAEQVLQHSLADGAQQIRHYVESTLALLPQGEECFKISVSNADFKILSRSEDDQRSHHDQHSHHNQLQTSGEGSNLNHSDNSSEHGTDSTHQAYSDQPNSNQPEWLKKLTVDSGLQAGECNIHSQHSLIEFSVNDAMQQQLVHLAEQLLHTSADYPNENEVVSSDIDIEETSSSESDTDANISNDESNTSDIGSIEPDTREARTEEIGDELSDDTTEILDNASQPLDSTSEDATSDLQNNIDSSAIPQQDSAEDVELSEDFESEIVDTESDNSGSGYSENSEAENSEAENGKAESGNAPQNEQNSTGLDSPDSNNSDLGKSNDAQ